MDDPREVYQYEVSFESFEVLAERRELEAAQAREQLAVYLADLAVSA